ncbi:MAG: protein phosphatase, partial [Psychromonas sp.]|nr:protein phosphatase [Psychromonas sp.]
MITVSVHHHYQQNDQGRDFFVGDIHGKYGLLMLALSNVNFNANVDRLFSVGDLIDRGEASF